MIDIRYLLRLDDGSLTYLQTRGFRHGPRDVLARIGRGETGDPALYYFRVQMAFETASTTSGWLNRSVAVGSALRPGRRGHRRRLPGHLTRSDERSAWDPPLTSYQGCCYQLHVKLLDKAASESSPDGDRPSRMIVTGTR